MRRILLVTAIMEEADLIRGLLEGLEFAVLIATTGRAALSQMITDALDGSPIDGIVMDDKIRDLDVLTTLREIHSRDPEMAVIVLSHYTDDQTIERFIEAGAQQVLSKPVVRTEFREACLRIFPAPSGHA